MYIHCKTLQRIKTTSSFLRSSNLLVRSSKSTSSPPALFPPGTLSGKLGRSVGTVGRSGKLGPDEGRGALGAGGWCGADRTKQNKTHNHIKIRHNKLGRKDRYNIKGYSLRDWVSARGLRIEWSRVIALCSWARHLTLMVLAK